MNDFIKVDYEVYTTTYSALKALNSIEQYEIALDFETRSHWNNEEIKEAKALLKENNLTREDERLCKLVSNSSGLSFPSITRTTHMIIGLSESKSIVIIISNEQMEKVMLNWVVNVDKRFIFWNALFDMKLIYVKTRKMVRDYDDGQLFAKCFLNHVEVWKANTGLKHLMGEYYHPEWCLIDGYDNEDLKDRKFLRYSAIDGCATYKAWELLKEMEKEDE